MVSNANPAGGDEGPSIIGSGILVDGNIEADVDLRIRGKVVGDVRCATLVLGAEGEIRGNVVADRVRLSGSVDGTIETGDLVLDETARVRGDVTYGRIKMVTGAVVQGRMSHVEREVPASAEPAGTGRTPPGNAPKTVYIE
jgi:cytoskeletal protein CcmA (bactofilin family)